MKRVGLLFFCVALSVYSVAQNMNRTIWVDGLQREYTIHLPPAYNRLQKLPLIFALHGGGSTAKSAVNFYGLEPLADENNFIVVYPNAIKKAWQIPGMATRVKNADTSVNDTRFISVLLDTLIVQYKVDDKKVFCTGISRGAMFSYYLAVALNSRIAAIAVVCGGISKAMLSNYSFQKPVPVLMINGTADPLVNYKGGFVKFNQRNMGNDDADLLPTEVLLKTIVSLNHCHATPQIIELPDNDPSDGCNETEYLYSCDSATVDFIKIENGGHTWAGGAQYLPKFIVGKVCRDFSASQRIIDFFKQTIQSAWQ